MMSPKHEVPSIGISHLLSFVRLSLIMAWVANVVLVSAAWLNAYHGGHTPKLLGPSALLGWIFLLGWLGWRTQFQRRTN
ncbi:hypothetical protein DES53_101103 [Roseimicrobium gellanilyticum]|uniref:Uncharacterized protein n=1 Tax=Roseimicrobium gellanilyticum TaxID=748857 RepID=A0A366HSQ4_9BACT|nr:hypothetical protein [Roseimicrobium gellanilyticum]RBP47306.1 hypothetical protein DES53_101103 [Roseimicrobium gellanilyticum]